MYVQRYMYIGVPCSVIYYREEKPIKEYPTNFLKG